MIVIFRTIVDAARAAVASVKVTTKRLIALGRCIQGQYEVAPYLHGQGHRHR